MQRPGIALVNVLIFMLLTSIFLGVGMQFVDNNRKMGRKGQLDLQAYHVAEAGINEAISWLRQQPEQPVTEFTPTASSTIDPSIGLVREWVVDEDRRLWGRFEVAGSTTAFDHRAVDVSLQRGAGTPGAIWRLRSQGILFPEGQREKPLDTIMLETEVRRYEMRFPEAALYSFKNGDDADSITDGAGVGGHIDIHAHDAVTNTRIRVQHGTALSMWTHTPASKVKTNGVPVWGSTMLGMSSPNGKYFVSPEVSEQVFRTFGVSSIEGVRAQAEEAYDSMAGLPAQISGLKFVYIKAKGTMPGDQVVFDDTHRLNGSGVLVVDGKLLINGDLAPQVWDGLIFTTSTYEQKMDTTVRGAVMTGGLAMIHGYASKVATLEYSKQALSRINEHLVAYREQRSTRAVVGAP